MSYLAPAQVAQGLRVTVIGGDPARMTAALAGADVAYQASGSALADARALQRLDRPSVIHAHMTAAEVVGVVTKPLVHAPVVATLHFAKPRGRDRLRRSLFAPLPRFLAGQIAISQFVADAADQPTAEVIPNGVPWQQHQAPRDRVVLVAQRLESEKDTATALRAWALSGLGQQGWRMVVAGAGAGRPQLDALVESLAVSDTVDLIGAVDDIPDRLAHASMFLATAPAEPFGLAVVEAMAAGTPVVAADGGAHPETVGRVGTSTLFPPGDAATASAIMRRLADDDGEREAIGAAEQREYRASFTIEHHAAQVHRLYLDVIQGSH